HGGVHQVPLVEAAAYKPLYLGEGRFEGTHSNFRLRQSSAPAMCAQVGRIERDAEQRRAPRWMRAASVASPSPVALRGREINPARRVQHGQQRREYAAHACLVALFEDFAEGTLGDRIETVERVADLHKTGHRE